MGTNNEQNAWQNLNEFHSGKLGLRNTEKAGKIVFACSPQPQDITLKIPSLLDDDELVTRKSGIILPNSANSVNNLGFLAKTAANARDTIAICQARGDAITSDKPVLAFLPNSARSEICDPFSITTELSILLTGAHWGIGTTGNITDAILRIGLINDGLAIPALAAYYVGGRNKVLSSDCFSAPTSVTLPEHVLTSRPIASGTWPIVEVGFTYADFNDTGDVWALKNMCVGISADGYYQNFNTSFPTGFSAAPATAHSRWTQNGRRIKYTYRRSADGTSNLVTTTQTIPSKAARIEVNVCGFATDNGVAQTTSGRIDTSAGSSVINVFKDPAGNSWTALGAKSCNFQIEFEVGPAASFIN